MIEENEKKVRDSRPNVDTRGSREHGGTDDGWRLTGDVAAFGGDWEGGDPE